MHAGEISGKLGLLERAFEHVVVRDSNLVPGFQHGELLHVTDQPTSPGRPRATTWGCGSIALSSCFNFCVTCAGSMARGKSFECFAGCSRCSTTRIRLQVNAALDICFSPTSLALPRAATRAARLSRTLQATSSVNSMVFARGCPR